jgi:hypothetical protein
LLFWKHEKKIQAGLLIRTECAYEGRKQKALETDRQRRGSHVVGRLAKIWL